MGGQESAYELLLTKNGLLYLRAMQDIVVNAEKPLGAMGNGSYDIGSDSAAPAKGHVFTFQVKSADQEALFAVGSGSKITATFKSGPASFNEFFRFLEENGQVGFKVPCHTWSRAAAAEPEQGASASGSACRCNCSRSLRD